MFFFFTVSIIRFSFKQVQRRYFTKFQRVQNKLVKKLPRLSEKQLDSNSECRFEDVRMKSFELV